MSQSSVFERTYNGAPWEQKVGYCRAIRAGPYIHVTGTVAIDDEGQVYAPGDAYRQAMRSLQLIERALNALGASKQTVVRTRLLVTEIAQWEAFGRAHAEFFEGHHPVTTMVEVSALIDPAMLIEIEVDAYAPVEA